MVLPLPGPCRQSPLKVCSHVWLWWGVVVCSRLWLWWGSRLCSRVWLWWGSRLCRSCVVVVGFSVVRACVGCGGVLGCAGVCGCGGGFSVVRACVVVVGFSSVALEDGGALRSNTAVTASAGGAKVAAVSIPSVSKIGGSSVVSPHSRITSTSTVPSQSAGSVSAWRMPALPGVVLVEPTLAARPRLRRLYRAATAAMAGFSPPGQTSPSARLFGRGFQVVTVHARPGSGSLG